MSERYDINKLISNQEEIEKYNQREHSFCLRKLFIKHFQETNLCEVVYIFQLDTSLQLQSVLSLPSISNNGYIDKSKFELLRKQVNNLESKWSNMLGKYEYLRESYDEILRVGEEQIKKSRANYKMAKIKMEEFVPDNLNELFGISDERNLNALLIRAKIFPILEHVENELLIFLFADFNTIDYTNSVNRKTIEQIFRQWINSFQSDVHELNISIDKLKHLKSVGDIIFESKKILKIIMKIHPWVTLKDMFYAFETMLYKLGKIKKFLEIENIEQQIDDILEYIEILKSDNSHACLDRNWPCDQGKNNLSTFLAWIKFRFNMNLYPREVINHDDLLPLLIKTRDEIETTLA